MVDPGDDAVALPSFAREEIFRKAGGTQVKMPGAVASDVVGACSVASPGREVAGSASTAACGVSVVMAGLFPSDLTKKFNI